MNLIPQKAAAARLKLSVQTLNRWHKTGRRAPQRIKIGGRYFYLEIVLDEFVDASPRE